MFPYIEIFGFEFATYGTLIVLGIGLAILLAALRAKWRDKNVEDVIYASLFACIGLLVGSKLLYWITILPSIVANFGALLQDSSALLQLFHGGFVFYGGLIGAVFMIWLYTHIYHLDFLRMLDFLIPSVALAHGIGRLGCFCAGCCYGRPFPPPVGMEFNASPIAPHDVTLLPTQLIESGFLFALCFLLLVLSKKERGRGFLTGVHLAGYAVFRFVIEFFRGDATRGFFLSLSTSQWISLLLLPIGVFLLVHSLSKKTTK